MKLAVVILNWNGRHLLEKFLPSVIDYSSEATIYLADNNSSDDSVGFVETTFPKVKIIKNKSNGGYAKGYNDALKLVDADIFCLLNSDVEVSKNWLIPIVETFNSNKNTAILQPKILDYNNKDCFEYAGAAGGFIDKYSYPYCRGRLFNTIEKDHEQFNDNTDIFWASGACLFIRKHVFIELNGFDERFFAHMEEIDLCWRAKNYGYEIKYVGSSKVFHVGGATLDNLNPKKTFLNFRNSLFALTKNAKGNIIFIVLVRLVLDGIAAFKFLLELKPSHFFAVLKSHVSYYYHLPDLLKERKSLKKTVKYYQIKSIVIAYFVKRKKYYNSL